MTTKFIKPYAQFIHHQQAGYPPHIVGYPPKTGKTTCKGLIIHTHCVKKIFTSAAGATGRQPEYWPGRDMQENRSRETAAHPSSGIIFPGNAAVKG
nr:hypothetical protein [uncultured Chitinophaga sp.]